MSSVSLWPGPSRPKRPDSQNFFRTSPANSIQTTQFALFDAVRALQAVSPTSRASATNLERSVAAGHVIHISAAARGVPRARRCRRWIPEPGSERWCRDLASKTHRPPAEAPSPRLAARLSPAGARQSRRSRPPPGPAAPAPPAHLPPSTARGKSIWIRNPSKPPKNKVAAGPQAPRQPDQKEPPPVGGGPDKAKSEMATARIRRLPAEPYRRRSV